MQCINVFVMKVVIDEKIPYLADALSAMGCEVVALPGVAISAKDVKDAAALFVRTRTVCDAALLAGSSVRFIGTATIGYDHIDAEFCAVAGIHWVSAAGCNAGAVLQYVQAVVYSWAAEKGVALNGLTLGVVGVGVIGSKVAQWASAEGMHLLLNDPPREALGEKGFVPLEQIARECDIITFHPTLSREGDFPSYHLADEAFLASLKKCRLFINASRGPVTDNNALLRVLEENPSLCAVLDVWEWEPDINLSLLNKVDIGTPHIAGYSAEGKMNATRMVLSEFGNSFGCTALLPQLSLPRPLEPEIIAPSFSAAVLKTYDPHADFQALKSSPASFEDLRNNYDLRREVSAFDIKLV